MAGIVLPENIVFIIGKSYTHKKKGGSGAIKLKGVNDSLGNTACAAVIKGKCYLGIAAVIRFLMGQGGHVGIQGLVGNNHMHERFTPGIKAACVEAQAQGGGAKLRLHCSNLLNSA